MQKKIHFLTKLNILFKKTGFFYFLFFLPIVLDLQNLCDFDLNDFIPSSKFAHIKGKITYVNDKYTTMDGKLGEYDYEFRYREKKYFGKSYSKKRHLYTEGETVTILFKPKNPRISRIEGLRSGISPKSEMLFFIFLYAIIFLVLFFAFMNTIKDVRIIENGRLVLGACSHKKVITSGYTDITTYYMYYTYEVNGKTYKIMYETTKGEETEIILDKNLEPINFKPIIYDVNNPENAMVIDALPKSARKLFEKEIKNLKQEKFNK